MVLRRYPLVVAALVVGVVGLVLLLTPVSWLVPWLVSTFALVVAAREGFTMIRRLIKREVGLDLLAVTAIVATVVVGEYWASLIIVLMLAGGEALEDYAAGRAERDLKALLDRVPQLAHRYGAGDVIEDIPIDAVAVGDRLLVRPAEIVPVDCELLSAATSLDESSLTGESMPVDKVRGDDLLSGSVNGPAAVDVSVTALAKDSQYQRIIELVREASASKSPMVRLADRYALPFTAVAFVIAGIAWFVSGDPIRFAEVLVVATPCPLLLAAPVAFMAGMSRAAKTGIVMKGAKSLELLARARTIAFDKTGTLTHGMPAVVAVLPVAPFTESTLLGYVASAERYSSHVLAQSLQDAASDRGIALTEAGDAHEVATHGIEATIAGTRVVVGKPTFVAERVSGLVRYEGVSGEAAVYVGVGDAFAGVIVLRDEVRPESAETLTRLTRLGITQTMLITGDVEQTARPIAEALGITRVHAECLPEDKVDLVRDATPRPVIMVGDGVNDAPVLAAADVGIALGARGSTAASESADVVILVDDLTRVADAVAIGHRTVNIALQCIWFGIAISVALMIVAAFGLIPAVLGAALQEVVDLITILGALRALGAGRGEGRGAGRGRVSTPRSSPSAPASLPASAARDGGH
ncbi:MAG: heavy metal translocating P-type ATPase [Rhodoglobus sp.]